MEKKTVQLAEAKKPKEEDKPAPPAQAPEPTPLPKLEIPPEVRKAAKGMGIDVDKILAIFEQQNKRIDRLEKAITILIQQSQGGGNPSQGGGGFERYLPLIDRFLGGGNPMEQMMMTMMSNMVQTNMLMNRALITNFVKQGLLTKAEVDALNPTKGST